MSKARESKVPSDSGSAKEERLVNAILPDYDAAFRKILTKKRIVNGSTSKERILTMTIVPVVGWVITPRAVWEHGRSARYPTPAWVITGVYIWRWVIPRSCPVSVHSFSSKILSWSKHCWNKYPPKEPTVSRRDIFEERNIRREERARRRANYFQQAYSGPDQLGE